MKNPFCILSLPKSGPTVLSSMILIGAGNAPDLSKIDKSLASWTVKFPDICPLPVVIASLITGALTTSLSITMAKFLPIFFFVIKPNFLAPKVSNLKFTTDELLI